MPELPEVESVRRVLDRVLVGKPLIAAEARADAIVFPQASFDAELQDLVNDRVERTGRKGKLFWMEFADRTLYGHLGMSGWIRASAAGEKRLISHGSAPLDDESGEPRFLKMKLATEQGSVAFTDGRRLARYWMGGPPHQEPAVLKLGPDVFTDPPTIDDLLRWFAKKKAPVKAALLDQTRFAGVGNWVADEVLFHARIAPARLGSSLNEEEVERLRLMLHQVVSLAVEAEADETRYPPDWLFHVRWGGGKGSQMHLGHELRRDTIGGRTTAWVPELQS